MGRKFCRSNLRFHKDIIRYSVRASQNVDKNINFPLIRGYSMSNAVTQYLASHSKSEENNVVHIQIA